MQIEDDCFKESDSIIRDMDNDCQIFIGFALKNFVHEIKLYLSQNEDDDFLEYFQERTYLSMFINGMIRKDKDVTVVQEYPVRLPDTKFDKRIDAFVNYKQMAFLIEAKYQKCAPIDGTHWDIDGWLTWDEMIKQNQLRKYHLKEKEYLIKYKSSHLMTLIFKVVNEDCRSHIEKSNVELRNEYNKIENLGWFYKVIFPLGKLGLEIYGTIEKIKIIK